MIFIVRRGGETKVGAIRFLIYLFLFIFIFFWGGGSTYLVVFDKGTL